MLEEITQSTCVSTKNLNKISKNTMSRTGCERCASGRRIHHEMILMTLSLPVSRLLIALIHCISHCRVGPTELEIRAQLAAEEEQAAANDSTISLHSMSPSGLLASLLDIEEHQYVQGLYHTLIPWTNVILQAAHPCKVPPHRKTYCKPAD